MDTSQSKDQAHGTGESQPSDSANIGTQREGTPASVGSSAMNAEREDEPEVFYLQEDGFSDDEPGGFGAASAAPFQLSGALPAMPSQEAQIPATKSASSETSGSSQARRFPLIRVILLVSVIVVLLLTGVMAVFAQGTPPFTTTAQATPVPRHTAATRKPPAGPTQTAKGKPTPTMATGQGTPTGDWIPQALPDGWTNAELSMGDALFAERTAATFTDREMSLDFRRVGTRARHGGTLTAATFLLTQSAKVRFAQNDVRVINDVLFDSVARRHLIQVVVNALPRLVAFTLQGQQQFAWVEVSFQLWQSQLDPQNPDHRIEGKQIDPQTRQPRTHHMVVLLLRIPPGTQGANAPMGGTGWLVSNYALDLARGTTLDIVQPA
jgi:hypothetical protein